MKAYVIVELGYEYDDQNYYRPECGGGNVVHAYLDKEKAKTECKALNKKEIARTKGNPDWSYDDEPIKEFFVVEEIEIQE